MTRVRCASSPTPIHDVTYAPDPPDRPQDPWDPSEPPIYVRVTAVLELLVDEDADRTDGAHVATTDHTLRLKWWDDAETVEVTVPLTDARMIRGIRAALDAAEADIAARGGLIEDQTDHEDHVGPEAVASR